MNKEPDNLVTIQETLKKCDWWLEGSYLLYAQSLKELGYRFLTKDFRGQTLYYAVHPDYESYFKQEVTPYFYMMPDWAIRSIPYEVYIK
jgi:hypothetical protein